MDGSEERMREFYMRAKYKEKRETEEAAKGREERRGQRKIENNVGGRERKKEEGERQR